MDVAAGEAEVVEQIESVGDMVTEEDKVLGLEDGTAVILDVMQPEEDKVMEGE